MKLEQIYCLFRSSPKHRSTFSKIAISQNFIRVQVNPLFKFGPNIRAVKLPPPNYVEVTGAKARVSGWGHRDVVQPSAAVMSQNKFLVKWKAGRQEVSLAILYLRLGSDQLITAHYPV
jgi:hypothetical protein